MTNLDSIFKSRDITLPTKILLIKAMVFPVFMYGSEQQSFIGYRLPQECVCWQRGHAFPGVIGQSASRFSREEGGYEPLAAGIK